MDAKQKQCELTDYALELIHHTARRLVGTAGFTRDDVEDIQQDLALELLERLSKFDPSKATYNTFVARVVERKVSKMIRHRLQKGRDYRREEYSLNAEFSDRFGKRHQHAQMIGGEKGKRHLGREARSEIEQVELEMDVAAVLVDLPPDLRQVAEMLTTMPVAQVAQALGVPRATFYDNHLARLREAFEAKGLREYLFVHRRHFADWAGK